LEQFKDGLGRIRLLEHGSEGIPREVYSSYFGIVGQGIDDQLEVGGGCGSSGRRHVELFTRFRLEGMDGLKEGRTRLHDADGVKYCNGDPTRLDTDAADLACGCARIYVYREEKGRTVSANAD
jgi:hypothetical protein